MNDIVKANMRRMAEGMRRIAESERAPWYTTLPRELLIHSFSYRDCYVEERDRDWCVRHNGNCHFVASLADAVKLIDGITSEQG